MYHDALRDPSLAVRAPSRSFVRFNGALARSTQNLALITLHHSYSHSFCTPGGKLLHLRDLGTDHTINLAPAPSTLLHAPQRRCSIPPSAGERGKA